MKIRIKNKKSGVIAEGQTIRYYNYIYFSGKIIQNPNNDMRYKIGEEFKIAKASLIAAGNEWAFIK